MFLDYKDISSREAYDFYRKNRKAVAKGIDQYNYFRKAVEGLMFVLKEMFLENEQGVCIRDFGYLCMLRSKEEKYITNPLSKTILKKYSKKHVYRPFLFPDVMYKGWHMEYAFSNSFIYDWNHSASKKYKLHKNLCDSIIVSEDFINKAEKNKKNPQRNKNYKKEARK